MALFNIFPFCHQKTEKVTHWADVQRETNIMSCKGGWVSLCSEWDKTVTTATIWDCIGCFGSAATSTVFSLYWYKPWTHKKYRGERKLPLFLTGNNDRKWSTQPTYTTTAVSQLLQLINTLTKHRPPKCSSEEACGWFPEKKGMSWNKWEINRDDKETKSSVSPDSRVHVRLCHSS